MNVSNPPRTKRLALAAALCAGFLLLLDQAFAFAIVVAPNGLGIAGEQELHEGTTLRIATRNGDTVEASVLTPAKATRPIKATVVLLHGVRMDKKALLARAQGFTRAGYRAVLVDLPGHGRSDGRFLTYGVGEAEALSLLLDELEARGFVDGGVGVYGFSYGGAVAIQLAARDPRVRAVVAISSFSSLERVVSDYVVRYVPVVGRYFPEAAVRTAVAEAGAIANFDPRDADAASVASRLQVPLLLMHGERDTQVPAYHSERLRRAAGAHARLVLLPGETHASIHVDASGAVGRASVGWFNRWLG